jgi:DNA polymerase I-like protein with 3'-5' exonuclease and polymerase domains
MKIYVFDIEANGLDEVTINSQTKSVMQEATVVHCAVVHELGTDNWWRYTPDNIHELPSKLNEADLLVAHNGINYDVPVVSRLLGKVNTKCFDTLIMSRLMYPDPLKHPGRKFATKYFNSLEVWGKRLGEYKGDYTGGWEVFSQEMLEYCEQDVVVTVKIYQYQMANGYTEALPEPAVAMDMGVSREMADLKERGFPYNYEQGRALEEQLDVEIFQVRQKLEEIFPPTKVEGKKPEWYRIDYENLTDTDHAYFPTKKLCEEWRKDNGYPPRLCRYTAGPPKVTMVPFDPASSDEPAVRFQEVYGWEPKQFSKKTGKPKMTTDILEHLGFEGAKLLIQYRRHDKVAQFLRNWNTRIPLTRDGRLHPTINPQGTNTGRASHSQPNIGNVDGDPRLRGLLLPFPGEVMVGIDQTGVEARILSHELYPYDNGEYWNILNSGVKIHWLNARRAGLWPKDEPYDPHNPAMAAAYAKAKTMVYAIMYGAFPPKVAAILDCTVSKAKRIMDTFKSSWTGYNDLQKALEYEAKKTGGLKLPSGRRIPVTDERLLINYKCQGTAAETAKLWILLAQKDVKPLDAKLLAWVHDELQYSVPEKNVAAVSAAVIEACAEAGRRLNIRVPLDASADTGTCWAETH